MLLMPAPGPWAAPLSLSRFTVGGQISHHTFINFMQKEDLQAAQRGSFTSQVIPVSLLADSSRFIFPTINVRKVSSLGPGPPLPTFPFHCWAVLRTSRILTFLPLMREDGSYTGYTVLLPFTRFTVGSHFPLPIPNSFSAGITDLSKRVKRH